jgi:DNA-binding MarR family transcriptional regulator
VSAPDDLVGVFEADAPGASREALAVFLTLAAKAHGSPASLSKTLELPRAAVLRALAELKSAELAVLSAPRGAAGRQVARLTAKGEALAARITPSVQASKRPHTDR